MSIPVVGSLSVRPLMLSSDGRLVWWDGQQWQQIETMWAPKPGPGFMLDRSALGGPDELS